MTRSTLQRRTPPAVVWAVLGVAVALVALCALLLLLLLQRAAQIDVLEAQAAALQEERLSLESRLARLQDSAAAAEQRLAALEASDPAKKLAALEQAMDEATSTEQVDSLRVALHAIQAQLSQFQSELDGLTARLDSRPPGSGVVPSEARILVAPQKQSHNLSCESSAASMAARYHGVGLSEEAVLAALPRNDNPFLGFRGNVDGPTGGIQDYGVYAGPIKAVLDANGLAALDVSGGLAGIRAAIARGNPVIAWVTYQLVVAEPVVQTIAGQPVTLVPNQHVVVVTGYDADGLWAIDPWTGTEVYYSSDDFVRALGYFGNMALEVARP